MENSSCDFNMDSSNMGPPNMGLLNMGSSYMDPPNMAPPNMTPPNTVHPNMAPPNLTLLNMNYPNVGPPNMAPNNSNMLIRVNATDPPRKILFNRKTCLKAPVFKPEDFIDSESVQGKFGWLTLKKLPWKIGKVIHIPTIYRRGEEFCSVRMFESEVLNDSEFVILNEVFEYCVQEILPAHTLTPSECLLLNEINHVHSDVQFGAEKFTMSDLIIRKFDALNLCKFMSICYMFANGISDTDLCGFVRISHSSVPYVVLDKVRYVPSNYFVDEEGLLKSHEKTLKGWNVPYLKLCLKVLNIGREHFQGPTCTIVDLSVAKGFFAEGTGFESHWIDRDDFRKFLRTYDGTRVTMNWLNIRPYKRESKGNIPNIGDLLYSSLIQKTLNIARDPLHINLNWSNSYEHFNSPQDVSTWPVSHSINVPQYGCYPITLGQAELSKRDT